MNLNGAVGAPTELQTEHLSKSLEHCCHTNLQQSLFVIHSALTFYILLLPCTHCTMITVYIFKSMIFTLCMPILTSFIAKHAFSWLPAAANLADT
jgi:hypothetical protein